MSQIIDSSKYNIYTKASHVHKAKAGSFGIVFLDESEKKIFEYGQRIEGETSNSIEYLALIRALELLGSRGESDILCFVNSELVHNQLREKYHINNENLKGLVGQLRGLEGLFNRVRYDNVSKDNEWIGRARVLARESFLR